MLRLAARSLIVSFLMIAVTSHANAEENIVTLTQTAEPVRYSFADRALDVLGIRPGDSIEQVRQVLERDFDVSTLEERKTAVSYTYKSVAVRSQEFTESVHAEKHGESTHDRISVTFGTPSTNNSVIGVWRKIEFKNPLKAPLLEDVVKSMRQKHGQASGERGSSIGTSVWIFNDNGITVCRQYGCFDGDGFGGSFASWAETSPMRMQDYREKSNSGIDLVLHAQVIPSRSDPSRVWIVEIVLVDYKNRALTYEQAVDQLNDGAQRVYEVTSKPTQAPKF